MPSQSIVFSLQDRVYIYIYIASALVTMYGLQRLTLAVELVLVLLHSDEKNDQERLDVDVESTLSLAISSLATVKLLPVARGQTGPRALQRSMNARGSPLASSSSGSRTIRGMVSSAQKTIMTERGRSVSHKRRAVLVRSCRSSRAPLWVSDASKHTLY